VVGDNPPDVALPAEVGLFREFARQGRVTPLSACPGLEELVREKYPPAFVDLGTVDGTLYGFFMKADTKATVFYSPAVLETHDAAPLTAASTFDDLIALSDSLMTAGVAPWSMGQESGGGSGFPGSDTIQQILLNDAGAEAYDGVIAGTLAYDGPEMRAAWERFGQIALTPGYTAQASAATINATNFETATLAPFLDPPQAAMTHIGGFANATIAEAGEGATPGDDFDFFPWPGGAITGGANIAYAFNSEPATCSFLSHIASAEAQEIWVDRGGFTSLNTDVSLDAYPNSVARSLAEQLVNAPVFRFDLDDAIGGESQQAIFDGVLRYLQDPSSLDAILADIEATRD
jgi:alpha-glucoside transport system substrate-binding protein